MFGGESGYCFNTRPYVPVEAAQTAVAALGFQQRCPYPPLSPRWVRAEWRSWCSVQPDALRNSAQAC